MTEEAKPIGRGQDADRAADVMNNIHNARAGLSYFETSGSAVRDVLGDLEPWLIEVFRAIRGDGCVRSYG